MRENPRVQPKNVDTEKCTRTELNRLVFSDAWWNTEFWGISSFAFGFAVDVSHCIACAWCTLWMLTTHVWFPFKNHLVGFDSLTGTQKGKKKPSCVYVSINSLHKEIVFFNYMIYNFIAYVMWHRMKVKSHSPNHTFNQKLESSGPHLKMKVSRAL